MTLGCSFCGRTITDRMRRFVVQEFRARRFSQPHRPVLGRSRLCCLTCSRDHPEARELGRRSALNSDQPNREET